MPRLTLRVLTVAAVALLAGTGCSADGVPTSTAAAPLASYQKLRAPAVTLAPRFDGSGERDGSSQDGERSSVSRVIDQRGGVIAVDDRYSLVFPAGAVSRPTLITMTAHGEYAGVELEPHGLQFPRGRGPVLTLSHEGIDVSEFQALDIAYIDDSGTILEVLPSRTSKYWTSAQLRHFSGYIQVGH